MLVKALLKKFDETLPNKQGEIRQYVVLETESPDAFIRLNITNLNATQRQPYEDFIGKNVLIGITPGKMDTQSGGVVEFYRITSQPVLFPDFKSQEKTSLFSKAS